MLYVKHNKQWHYSNIVSKTTVILKGL